MLQTAERKLNHWLVKKGVTDCEREGKLTDYGQNTMKS